MDKIFARVVFGMMVSLFICSCSAFLGPVTHQPFPEPGQNIDYSEDEQIVFGRIEILKSGQPAPLNSSTLHLLPDSPRLKNEFNKGRKYLIDISPEDGYFVASLPPGSYIIEGITPSITPMSLKNLASCSNRVYDGSSRCNIIKEHPMRVTFQVTDKATYIGTIQAEVYTRIVQEKVLKPKFPSYNPFTGVAGSLAQWQGNPSEERIVSRFRSDVSDWKIINEYQEAKKIFLALFPDHAEPVANFPNFEPCTIKHTFNGYYCEPIN